jgi:cell division protein FtsB
MGDASWNWVGISGVAVACLVLLTSWISHPTFVSARRARDIEEQSERQTREIETLRDEVDRLRHQLKNVRDEADYWRDRYFSKTRPGAPGK